MNPGKPIRERKRTRLIGFDYATPGCYFVTAVVKDRLCVFGEINNGTIQLSPYGAIVRDQWRWLTSQYPYLATDVFVVMPNHIHAIINIADRNVGDGRDRPLREKTKSVSELVGALKTTSSKYIHRAGLTGFQWQRSFYERIIRSEQELDRIREYIQTNPLRWQLDVENPGRDGRNRPLRNRSAQDYYDEIFAQRARV